MELKRFKTVQYGSMRGNGERRMRELPVFGDPANLVERDEEPDAIELAPDEGSVDLLQKIYRSSRQPIARRMRAAIEAAPNERPKLAVTAVSNLSGDHFAAMLERAVQRSRAPLQIEHRPNDGPLPEPRPRGIHGRSGEGQR